MALQSSGQISFQDIQDEFGGSYPIQANEYYEFDSGFDGYTACKNTSDALMPAVQNLVAKVYKSPQFIDLVKTSNK